MSRPPGVRQGQQVVQLLTAKAQHAAAMFEARMSGQGGAGAAGVEAVLAAAWGEGERQQAALAAADLVNAQAELLDLQQAATTAERAAADAYRLTAPKMCV